MAIPVSWDASLTLLAPILSSACLAFWCTRRLTASVVYSFLVTWETLFLPSIMVISIQLPRVSHPIIPCFTCQPGPIAKGMVKSEPKRAPLWHSLNINQWTTYPTLYTLTRILQFAEIPPNISKASCVKGPPSGTACAYHHCYTSKVFLTSSRYTLYTHILECKNIYSVKIKVNTFASRSTGK